MKIAIVCSRLCFGGAERVAVMWANGFANRGHEVILISNLFEEQTYYVDKKIRLYNLVSTNRNKIKKWSSAIWNVRKVVGREQPDVIIGVMETCSLVSWLGSLGFRIPIIMTEHNSFERPASAPMTLKSYIFKFYINKLYRHVTVLTLADKLFIGNRLKNVSVMPNPLFLSQLQGKPIRENTFLAAGRLDDWHYKGFDVLIRAWARIVSSFKFLVSTDGWKMQIAGTGSEESLNYLKQLCRENGVEDSVEFLGFRKDVEKLYQDASVFVLSSRYEGFGLVLIEAMSQGCACIACDYKGRQREIMCPEGQGSKLPPSLSRAPRLRDSTASVDDLRFKVQGSNNKVELCETGILCEPDDVESLAAGIQKMIEDDKYRERIRMNAIERSKCYSIDRTMDRWEKLLNQII